MDCFTLLIVSRSSSSIMDIRIGSNSLEPSQILDAAVVPVEDEEVGQIPMAYVVGAASTELITEDQSDPPQKSQKSWVYICHSKISCKQNLEEGTCWFTKQTANRLQTIMPFPAGQLLS